MPRYVVIGAGAIGVTLAAELHRAGHAVALIARGAQLRAAREQGITYVRPDGERQLTLPVYAGPEEVELTHNDVLILATKSQDAAAAIALWSACPVIGTDREPTTAGQALPIITTQNGIETERVALRFFATVDAAVLLVPAEYIEPGVVVAPGAPAVGAVWIGAFPPPGDRAADPLPELNEDRHEELQARARDLRRANLITEVSDDITAVKNGKLISSVTFALDALCEPSPLRDSLAARVQQEATEILTDTGARISRPFGGSAPAGFAVQAIPGRPYGGTSTWQSLRRDGSVESDFLNGEVVLQARLRGRAAPLNARVLELIHRAKREHASPRALSGRDLIDLFPLSDPGVLHHAG